MYKITLKSVWKRKNWPVYRIASSRISETTCLYIEFIVLQRAELARVYCIILNLEILHVTWASLALKVAACTYLVRLVHTCSPINQQLDGLNVAFLQSNKEWCISFLYITYNYK